MTEPEFIFGFDPGVGKDWTSHMSFEQALDDDWEHMRWSPERLAEIKQRLNFIFDYEVDPSWRGFCEFGHKDIGGPFEQLGVIRKRVRGDELLPYQMHVFKPMMYRVDDLSAGWWNEVPLDVQGTIQERAICAVNDHCLRVINGFVD